MTPACRAEPHSVILTTPHIAMLTPPRCHAERSEASALSIKAPGIIHAFAQCNECEYTTQNHTTGRRNAKTHAKRHGPRVKLDVGTIEIVDHRKETP